MRAIFWHVYDPHYRCYILSCNTKRRQDIPQEGRVSWLMGWFKAKRDRPRRTWHLLARCAGVTVCDLFSFWKPSDWCLCARFSDPALGMFHFSAVVGWMRCNGTQPYLIQTVLRYVAFSWSSFVYICNCVFLCHGCVQFYTCLRPALSMVHLFTFYLATSKEGKTFHKASVSWLMGRLNAHSIHDEQIGDGHAWDEGSRRKVRALVAWCWHFWAWAGGEQENVT